MHIKKAIVIGASSGIGKALSKILSEEGYSVGLASRRLALLNDQKNSLQGETFVKQIDITNAEESMNALAELIKEMEQVDLIVIASGVGNINEHLDWELEYESIATNVSGFSAMANVAIKHFIAQESGHLVGISSVAALRGAKNTPAYNASKAYVSNYLEGLRQKVANYRNAITVTEIRPGFVDTTMAKGEGLFWISPVEKAAKQIYSAIKAKKILRVCDSTLADGWLGIKIITRFNLQSIMTAYNKTTNYLIIVDCIGFTNASTFV